MDSAVYMNIVGVLMSGLVSFIVASVYIGTYKNKVDTNCNDISEIKKEQKEIRDKVISCETSLKEREPYTKRKSPISLTERGQELLNNSGGRGFIEGQFEKLLSEIEAKDPKTAYDIQEFSRQAIDAMSDDNLFNPLKEFLFKEGIDLADLVNVMGIDLRDRVLVRKNWKTADIDKYDPNHKK